MRIGIDIGGTSVKLGIVEDSKVTARARISTPTAGTPADFAAELGEAVLQLTAGKSLKAVGIGAPNGNQLNGCIEQAPNLPWSGSFPLAAMMQEYLKTPCTLGNDANAAAMGIGKYGVGQGCADLLVITLGTGLGSGFISNNQLILGARGNAGELGHSNIVIDGRTCSCGCKGCLEAYVSIRGMRETYRELADNEDLLQNLGVLPIAKAAQDGDHVALQTFTSTARWLGIGLATAVAIFAPSKIVLFGGIARSGDLLLAPLRMRFEEFLMPMHKGQVPILLSELPEDDAAILGAAALTL